MSTAQNPPLAIAFMLSATAFIAATTLLAKALGTDTLGAPLNAFQISNGRYIFALIALLIFAAITRPKIIAPKVKLHVARALFGWLGVTLMFAAASKIPLSDATTISFLNPVFAMILAIPLLGEKVGPVRWSAAVIALVGALVLLRPGAGSLQIGALLALGSAAILGTEIIVLKHLSKGEGVFQILLFSNAIGTVLSLGPAAWVFTPPTPHQWAALVAIGLIMASAQVCFVNALKRADASFIVPFSYATLLFATLYDALIFRTLPDTISVLGAAIIIAGAALLAWREGRIKASSDSRS
ncbi:DMT family transporter [Algirhabdus cladophorae]|uniref:DMT family transporter n=1 Tax=Algirhabdus cladophorae TaxID=3377108 RepID=UPI003B84B19A